MGNEVYQKKNFSIIKIDRSGYIVINKNKDFEEGHTHLKSFKTAKMIVDLALNKLIPNHLSQYLLISLIRISEDLEYINKLEILLNNKKNKTQQNYYNKKSNRNGGGK